MNSWKPIRNAPKEGTFEVWLETKDPIMDSRIGIMRTHPNASLINGHFAFDKPKPLMWRPQSQPPKRFLG